MDLSAEIERNVAAALTEDVGTGDLTAQLIPLETRASARVISRVDAVLCGARWFEACFRHLDPALAIEWSAQDGAHIKTNQTLCEFSGQARALLTGERTALNLPT